MNSHSRSRWRGIERRRRLVEQQRRRLAQQADRDVDALLVAAREPADLLVGAVLEAGLGEHPRDGRLRVGDLLEPREQPQVLGDRQLRVQRRLLRHPADLLCGMRDLALGRRQDPGEDREQRRLAGAVRPDDRDQLPGVQLEADSVQRGPRAESLGQERTASVAAAAVARCSGTSWSAVGRGERYLARRPDPGLERGAADRQNVSSRPGTVPQSGHRSGAERQNRRPRSGHRPTARARDGGAGRRRSGG